MATNEPAPDRDELAGKETYVVDGVTYTVHSAAALFPLLPPSIYEDLVADIRKHGIRQPVLVFGTEIVDGRNRVRAGLEAGVQIPIEQIADEETIYEIAASANLHRRSLVPSQRAYIAEQLHRMAVEARRERQALRDRARNRRWRLEHRGACASPAHSGAGGDVAGTAGPAAPPGGSAAAAPTAGASVAGDGNSVPAPGSRADERPSSAAAPDEGRGAVSAPRLVDGKASEPPAPESAGPPSASDVPDIPEPMPAPTSADLARRMGVSERSVGRVRAALAAAPCLGPLLRLGQLNVREAYAARNEPKELLEAAAALIASGSQTSLRDALAEARGGKRAPRGSRMYRAEETGDDASLGLPPMPGDEPPASSGGGEAEPGGWSLPGGLGGAAAATAAAADSTPPPEVLARMEKDRIAAWSLPADFLSPDPVIDAVRELLGPIDLDPCSHEAAQCVVGARAWYEFGEDASRDHWKGAVYLFPPVPQVSRLVDKLAAELEAGRVERAALFSTFDLRDRWVGTLLGHRCLSAVVVSERPPKIPSAAALVWQAPLPMALYLFGVKGDGGKVAEVLDYWGHVFTVQRSDQ
ncbi:MAG: hypothetical protein F4X11_14020 [Acidobacteria bacterium]|nr:hypothetical protein [Acidobacteriota bacterium]